MYPNFIIYLLPYSLFPLFISSQLFFCNTAVWCTKPVLEVLVWYGREVFSCHTHRFIIAQVRARIVSIAASLHKLFISAPINPSASSERLMIWTSLRLFLFIAGRLPYICNHLYHSESEMAHLCTRSMLDCDDIQCLIYLCRWEIIYFYPANNVHCFNFSLSCSEIEMKDINITNICLTIFISFSTTAKTWDGLGVGVAVAWYWAVVFVVMGW